MAGLVMDAAHNLYGTTYWGGSSTTCGYGCGTVFRLTPPSSGQTAWTFKTLTLFDFWTGAYPTAGLVLDAVGNLYGTTTIGDPYSSYFCAQGGCGTVFRLAPPASGKTAWTFKKLVSFNWTNGAGPIGGLARDATGNLYGTTSVGGGHGEHGTVFKITP
jgi:uncharacterized repeat protein (TIGR03803 family)